jgi:hypothetical protein
LKVKPERVLYLSEMTAAAAAVSVFIAVYVLGFMHTGVLLTFLIGWIPAAVLAWLTARALRSVTRSIADLVPGAGPFEKVARAPLGSIAVRSSQRVPEPSDRRHGRF